MELVKIVFKYAWITKEKYVEVFNNYSKQVTIDFIGQDTICFNCKTQL